MARSRAKGYREEFWEQRLAGASTPKKKVHALQSKILADIEHLPPEQQDAARNLTITALTNILDEIQIKVAEEAWT